MFTDRSVQPRVSTREARLEFESTKGTNFVPLELLFSTRFVINMRSVNRRMRVAEFPNNHLNRCTYSNCNSRSSHSPRLDGSKINESVIIR